MSNFQSRTAANYRTISTKWNAAYKETTKGVIADLNETESLLQQLEQQELDNDAIDDIIDQITRIRQRNLLNERYSFNFFTLLSKWYQHNEKNWAYKRPQLSLRLGFSPTPQEWADDGAPKKELLGASKQLASGLVLRSGFETCSIARLNSMKLAYLHLWNHCRDDLPSFESVYGLRHQNESAALLKSLDTTV